MASHHGMPKREPVSPKSVPFAVSCDRTWHCSAQTEFEINAFAAATVCTSLKHIAGQMWILLMLRAKISSMHPSGTVRFVSQASSAIRIEGLFYR